MRTSLALGFGWICGALTVQITDSVVWGLTLAFVAGLAFGIGEATWDRSAR